MTGITQELTACTRKIYLWRKSVEKIWFKPDTHFGSAMWRYWISSCKNIILNNFQGLTFDLDRYISEDVTKRRGGVQPTWNWCRKFGWWNFKHCWPSRTARHDPEWRDSRLRLLKTINECVTDQKKWQKTFLGKESLGILLRSSTIYLQAAEFTAFPS